MVLELKAAWGDGTTHLVFEPLDFLGRLAALTPRPRINLVVYHGALAPHARSRAAVVRYGVAASAAAGPITEAVPTGTDSLRGWHDLRPDWPRLEVGGPHASSL